MNSSLDWKMRSDGFRGMRSHNGAEITKRARCVELFFFAENTVFIQLAAAVQLQRFRYALRFQSCRCDNP